MACICPQSMQTALLQEQTKAVSRPGRHFFCVAVQSLHLVLATPRSVALAAILLGQRQEIFMGKWRPHVWVQLLGRSGCGGSPRAASLLLLWAGGLRACCSFAAAVTPPALAACAGLCGCGSLQGEDQRKVGSSHVCLRAHRNARRHCKWRPLGCPSKKKRLQPKMLIGSGFEFFTLGH